MKSTFKAVTLILGTTGLTSGCASRYDELEAYTPGLGEIMAQSAARHNKLWHAGQANSWELAAYEIDELREGFEDAGKYHQHHKQIPEPIPDLIAVTMDSPLAGLEQAVADKNLQAFTEQYDALTAACNTCHHRTGFAFNIVTRPTANPFTNQAFKEKD